MGADVAAEGKDCGEVYLEDLCSHVSFSSLCFLFGTGDNGSPRSNHYPEILPRDAVSEYQHSSLGY